ncbi:hypothetical protein RMATCC62417_14921 [Rhizopus microsporus]|nr:hypothetical protein RMATCC62417_14921 [Rhizopus microsporus]
MPLVVFGDGLTNKSSVRFRGLRHGVSEKIYKHLKLKEKLGELCLLDIDKFRTSQVCNSCKTRNLKDVMAAKNMFYVAEQIWLREERPVIFQRSSQ